MEAEGGQMADWYVATHHHLINWYKDFIKKHPGYRNGYLWLMDQLLADHRFAEASDYLTQMAQMTTLSAPRCTGGTSPGCPANRRKPKPSGARCARTTNRIG